jgi:hypothetical protein
LDYLGWFEPPRVSKIKVFIPCRSPGESKGNVSNCTGQLDAKLQPPCRYHQGQLRLPQETVFIKTPKSGAHRYTYSLTLRAHCYLDILCGCYAHEPLRTRTLSVSTRHFEVTEAQCRSQTPRAEALENLGPEFDVIDIVFLLTPTQNQPGSQARSGTLLAPAECKFFNFL